MASSILRTTSASDKTAKILEIPVLLWVRLVCQLFRRGRQRRESGAFLLGTTKGDRHRVRMFVCYDDLDPHALDTGIVTFAPTGFAALWGTCRRHGFEVLGDVHTHGGGGQPIQSETDRTNPMMPEPGHMAFILPAFAGTWGWKLKNIAIYEYAGNYRWHDWAGLRRNERVRFRWW